jgi:diamine N-acetyltransferase
MKNEDLEVTLKNITARHGDSLIEEAIKESLDKVTSTQLPIELKAPLEALGLTVARLCETLPRYESRRVVRSLQRLVDEITAETAKSRVWEVSLDFLGKLAQSQGEEGQAVLDIIASLAPILAQRFGPYQTISLQELTEDNVGDICVLSWTLSEPYKNYVAQNAISIAQGHYSKHAWMRAIYADEVPVGFMMLYDDPEEPDYFLWRFMIAEPYHGRGFGRKAIELLIEYVKTRPGAKELQVSCGQGEGSPEKFYQKIGFKPNGKKYGQEISLSLELNSLTQ